MINITINDVINVLEEDKEQFVKYRSKKDTLAYEVTISILKMQIPKMPIYSEYDLVGDDDVIPTKAVCPNCKEEFEFGTWNEEEHPYCWCGQRIDWAKPIIEERHSKWIEEVEHSYKCPNCNFIVNRNLDVCPHCGTIMDDYNEGDY